MTTSLLTTKLYSSPLQPNHVSREILIKGLNAGLNSKCTLVSAPAGFGKTTLLSEWANTSTLPFAWVTLNESDNDIGLFLSYIIAALNNIGLNIDNSTITLLQSTQPVSKEVLLGPLINQIESIGKKHVLVLDDYHLISSKQIHGALNFLIDNQPQNLHLVLSGRADPPIRLARLRANGQLTEIRVAVLKFSTEESERFLNHAQGLSLEKSEIETLVNQTEGWIAGLQLAAISLIGKDNTSAYIQEFSGSFDYVADYFADEVLNQQPEHIQKFLLKTSILNLLCGGLCQKVTGMPKSTQILNELKKNNLFLISLDDKQQWFRYHRLFADLLHQRLLVSYPDILPDLYLKASEWFEDENLDSKAIEHAINGKHFERAAKLIERTAESTLVRSETQTFIRWIEQIPQKIILTNATLSIYYAWALLIGGRQPDKATPFLENIPSDNQQDTYRSYVVKSVLAFFNRNPKEASEYASLALENLPENDFFFRNTAAMNLSALMYIEGNMEKGEEALNEVIRTSQASGNILVAVIALCRQGQAQMQKGLLHQPKGLFQGALDLSTGDDGDLLPVASEALLGLGKVHWHWKNFEVAAEYTNKSIETSKLWREMTTFEGYLTLAHIRQSQGNENATNSLIAKVKKISKRTTDNDYDDRFADLNQAHLWIRQGDLQAAKRWVKERGLDTGALFTGESLGKRTLRNYEQIVHARILILENQAQKAIQLLDLILPEMEKTSNIEKLIEVNILMALAYEKQSQSDRALSCLQVAFQHSQAEGYIRPYTDEIHPIRELIQKAAKGGIEPGYARLLLESFQTKKFADKQPKILESLSEREIDVMPLLATDLTVPEIAERLYVATSTIRSHIKSIYSKLGVHSRHEAVTKAKEIGLL